MKDCVGNEVRVGDIIATNHSKYKSLVIAEVVKLTPKGVTILPLNKIGYSDDGSSTFRPTSQIAVINLPELQNARLSNSIKEEI